jgi:hypothetical protein
MTSKLTTMQWVLVGVAAVVGGLFLGILGMAIGADFGGKFCDPCEFNGVTGYEATGQVGFFIGTPLGFIVSAWGIRAFLLWLRARVAR